MTEENVWLERVTRWLAQRVGVVHPEEKQARVAHAVRQRMRARGADTWAAYWRLLMADKKEQQALIDLVTVTETCFYRHPALYRALAYHVFPKLHEALPPGMPLRVWSAATATGEEAYTLAMALRESGVADVRRAVVLGTDINAQALVTARRGLYRRHTARRLPSAWRRKYLQETPTGVLMPVPPVRSLVHFAQFNLADLARGAGPPLMPDVVICANVLIYFAEAAVRQILQQLALVLTPGSLLYVDEVLGHLAREAFEPVQVGGIILYRPRRQTVQQSVACRTRQRVSEAVPAPSQASPGPSTGSPHQGLDHVMRLIREGELAAAERSLQEHVQSQPLDAAAHYLLGRIYMARQEWDKAREALSRAVYLNPSLAVAYLELGNLWQQIGHRKRAAKMFEQALRALEQDTLSPELGYPPALLRAAATRGLAHARQEESLR